MTHERHQDLRGSANPRPLTSRQRETLDFLLSIETPGVEELRRQSQFVLAKPWDCGCASIDLVVERERVPRSSISARPALQTRSRERDDPKRIFDLLLWVENGWLSAIELVEYGFERHEDAPDVFPRPSDFEPPSATT